MNRSLGVRYLPLAAVIAIQLLIIGLAPSKQAGERVVAGPDPSAGVPGLDGFDAPGSSDGSDEFDFGPVPGTDDGTSSGNGSTPTTGGGPGGRTPGVTSPPVSRPGVPTPTTGPGSPTPGDKSHCSGDRQFDPAIDFYAPPCLAKFTGTNTGSDYQGVTGDTITIVQYYGKGSDAVDTIQRAQGTFVSPQQHRDYNVKAAQFINDHYKLYGRKVEIKLFEGRCETIPPEIDCLRSEIREMVKSLKPFAVFWNASLCSECYQELSKLRTINLGGWNFRDEFGQRWRPYHYDITMSGTRLAQHAGQLWCQQMTGGNAIYARDTTYQGMQRQLGVLSTNDPENQATVEVDLKSELARCGQDYGPRKYFYKQDVTTADQQRRAGVLAMRGPDSVQKGDDATSVMCFCDLVAPAFLYQEEDVQQYYPENLIVGSGFMDSDNASQAYEGAVGCPQGRPCAFEGAFGFKSTNFTEPKFTGPGHRVWKLGGGGDAQTPFENADTIWSYLNLIASAAQMAGPTLNPENFEAGAFRLGARGDATHALRQISPGNYSWGQDVSRVYWSSKEISPYNGDQGTYIPLDPARISVDQWTPGQIQLPAAPR